MLNVTGLSFSLAALFLAAALPAQTSEKLTARELFYTPVGAVKTEAAAQPAKSRPAKSAKKPEPAKVVKKVEKPAPERRSEYQTVSADGTPLGLRYSLLKRTGGGSYEEVDADAVFHSGDKIRVEVESNDQGYLYIVQRGSSQTWNVLFPSPDLQKGSNRIAPTRKYTIPADGVFAFDDQAGTEKLFVVLSRKPEPDLEKLIYSLSQESEDAGDSKTLLMAQSNRQIADAFVSRLRNEVMARDLVFEKVDEESPGEKKEKAVYVVSPDGSSAARVVVDLNLKHQ